MPELPKRPPRLRVAVEGCGHGTLNSIYASVEESCRVKGWDGVDLLIIGGDFQAVRNKHDLNVTAMPVKYRRMADFHEYYSRVRSAPYLTIFIGGNHEASNHLFELYYGGWVAPNIYYMGAANILRLGPIRIAGLSGIWKGYDYRKPHFERLPYNESEAVSIFHVRELDVRKLLSVRTQVDVGLSHDWPQGVEWKGDFRLLFAKKDRFEADAVQGRLGSVAAKQCLDRLRPSYWFSAHLHIKYAAMVSHDDSVLASNQLELDLQRAATHSGSASTPGAEIYQSHNSSKQSGSYAVSSCKDGERVQLSSTRDLDEFDIDKNENVPLQKSPEQAKVSAWRDFHADAIIEAAKESERLVREQSERTAADERTGNRSTPQYMFEETWKQIEVAEEGRGIASVSRSSRSPGEKMSNVDGCVESKLKRPRSTTPQGSSGGTAQIIPSRGFGNGHSVQFDRKQIATTSTAATATKNTDEIDIDLSDSASEDAAPPLRSSPDISNKNFVTSSAGEDGMEEERSQNPNKRVKSDPLMSDESDEGGVRLDPTSPTFVPKALQAKQASLSPIPIREEDSEMEVDQDEVSDAMRAQLAELSGSFAPAPPVSAALSFPETIKNTTTQFLALDKCDRGRDFLQLLELEPISEEAQLDTSRPYRLQYDPEWLAILRAFAPELELRGDSKDKTAMHRGDTYYRERVVDEKKWVEEHIVQQDRLAVPENFAITAPVYEAEEQVSATASPREYTNPQTSTFCQLIGIENKFDMNEEERESRMTKGARPMEKKSFRGNGGVTRGGRGTGNSTRGRGGHSFGRGGRGWGRGRGGRDRGRGGW